MKALVMLLLLAVNVSCSSNTLGIFPCSMKPDVQTARSEELQKLYNEDQSDYRAQIAADSTAPMDLKKMEQMANNDLKRRKRVGEILAEGCFQKSADYAAAAMIYQHGNSADHYFLAFTWAKEALALGDTREKSKVAQALDRYLVSIGHKQIFGTQLFKGPSTNCYCLQPIEETFPSATREDYLPNQASYGMTFLSNYNGKNHCPEPNCPTNLLPSPKGTVVGFW